MNVSIARTRKLTAPRSVRALVYVLFTLLAGGLAVAVPPVGAQDLGADDPTGALELAEKYAPIMMLKAQEATCDENGEPYAPTSVDILMGNPEILLRQLGTNNPVIKAGPEPSDLYGLGEGFFLDFPGSALQPGCIYEKDFDKYSEGRPAVVYAHIVKQPEHPDLLALQYWFYWYYNDWNNKHESDWEGIQLLFSASTIEEALSTEPDSVGYAQHEGGERVDWESSRLTREGTHPVVYSSAGSHASYIGSALYLGRAASEGFGCDNTEGPSDRLAPDVVVLPDSVSDPSSPLAWLGYNGRWGERQEGPFNGPTGPAAKGRWLAPIDWHQELRSTSVVIPGGDNVGNTVVTSFCGVVKAGSGSLISLTTSPLSLLISFVAVVLFLSWLTRRTVWERVKPLPLRRRRRAGQIIRAAGNAFRRSPGLILTFGLIYLPAAVAGALIAVFVAILPVLKDILGQSDGASGSDLFLSLVSGSIPNIIALVFVNAAMAVHLDRAGSDAPISVMDAARLAWDRRRTLAAGLLRASVIVVVLFLTVVGIPFGIWQLIRYQFMPHAVMLEDLDGRAGLARSTQLVRGRWWHTAAVISVFNAIVIAASIGLGIVLLVLVSQVPLWAFSVLMTLMFALVSPLSAFVITLLYGNAIAENQGAAAADPDQADGVSVPRSHLYC
ncbi:MAG: Vps62-related protein [Acidimicrobiia bacterium]|nr:Vps62-related protein [Acidimicrobiia bacterium]